MCQNDFILLKPQISTTWIYNVTTRSLSLYSLTIFQKLTTNFDIVKISGDKKKGAEIGHHDDLY